MAERGLARLRRQRAQRHDEALRVLRRERACRRRRERCRARAEEALRLGLEPLLQPRRRRAKAPVRGEALRELARRFLRVEVLEIDSANRPEGFEQFATFHPTFLYESLWNLLGVAVLLLVDRRVRIRAPGVFALYVAWYTFGRFWEELLRIDPSHEYLGLRLNAYVAIAVFVAAVAAFVWSQRRTERPARRRPQAVPETRGKMAIPKGRIRHGR